MRQKKPDKKQPKKKPALPVFERDVLYAYTDGSTHRANPGPMTWAVVFLRNGLGVPLPDGSLWTDLGGHQHGTNNRAELLGVIRALELAPREDLIVVTDSTWVINCVTGLHQRRMNLDLWRRFDQVHETRKGLRTSFHHVKGHSGDPFNCQADQLARQHAKECWG